jgi:peptidyl-prolyl cis-trans isomerase A (cyclophilin A)
MECYRSIALGSRNKRDIALKADAEAAMEKEQLGLKKTESGLRYNSFKEKVKRRSWKTVSVHYEGS